MRKELKLIAIILMLSGWGSVNAREKQVSDSIEMEMKRHFRHDILSVSPKGDYALVAKRHNLNNDTVEVVQASRPGRIVTQLVGLRSGAFFLGEKAVIAYGNGNAELTNLETLEKKKYERVKSIIAIPERQTFIIVDQFKNLSSYDQNGKLKFSFSGVEQLSHTSQSAYLFIVKSNNNYYEIIDVSSDRPLTVYSSKKLIKRIEMSFSKAWLYVIEEDRKNGVDTKETLVLINMKTGVVHRPDIAHIQKDQFITTSEMAGGEELLISLKSKIYKDKKIELWYGNDGNLIDMELGFTPQSTYLVFNPTNDQIKNVLSERFDSFYPTGNKRYLIGTKRGEGNNYTYGQTSLLLYLWDLETGKYTFLDGVYPTRVYMPSKGNVVVYRNNSGRWVFVEISSGKKKVFTEDFSQPVFSDTSQEIYLEGESGFYVYDIAHDQLRSYRELQGKEVTVTRRKSLNMGGSYLGIYFVETESNKLLLRINDPSVNTTSYQWLKEGKLQNFIPATSDYVDKLHLAFDTGNCWYMRENYNRPTSIWFKSSSSSKPVEVIAPNILDRSVARLKQEILEYKNAESQRLKALLYYPENFDPAKKYPMIVRIYELQNMLGNNYQTSSYELPLEVDIRAMLKKGYFIYLPDIVRGKNGSGLSALSCVNASLDALKDKPFIDFGKVGLIGHSHGGYETNFIATHSKRFAAFISGAGNADIIRSYFSYNYNFHLAQYFLFENGQYKFRKSFVEDKELYFKNNPIHYAENVSAPILLWAGKKDENIRWEQGMAFYIALRRNNKDVIAMFYPDQGHSPQTASRENRDLYMKMLEWWDYFLKDKKDIPWIDKQMKPNPPSR